MSDPTRIALYAHLSRTLTPCTGVGRHCNGVGLALSGREDVDVRLAVCKDHFDDSGALPGSAPLRRLPAFPLPMSERAMLRRMKLTGAPLLDPFLLDDIDWIYCPHDVRIRSRRARVAITIHDPRMFETDVEPRGWKDEVSSMVMRAWMRRATRDADIVFTVSEFSRRRLIELVGLPDRQVVSVGNGVDQSLLDKIEARRPAVTGRPRSGTLVTIGGLRRMKGGEHVVRLAEVFRQIGDPTRILSIGGPDEADLVAQADRLGNIERTGFIDDDRLHAILRDADALIFLSRYEGFGLPVLEAMALGAPVIAARSTSLPEVVGDAGILLDPADTRGLLAALRMLETQPERRAGLQEAGFRRVRDYSWDRVANSVLEAMTARAKGRGEAAVKAHA